METSRSGAGLYTMGFPPKERERERELINAALEKIYLQLYKRIPSMVVGRVNALIYPRLIPIKYWAILLRCVFYRLL